MKNQKKEKRLAMNRRFIKAFKALEEKGDIVPNSHDKGMTKLSLLFWDKKGNGHLVRAFLNPQSSRAIDFDKASRFCEEFGVNKDYLLQGKGPMFGEEDAPAFANGELASDYGYGSQILYSSQAAFASSALGIDSYEEGQYFSLPGLSQGDYVAFTISGDSMQPTLSNGDLVICRPLEGIERVQENEVYAIVSSHGVQVKRIQKVFNKNRLTHLKLISDNYLEHDPFMVEVAEVRKIMKVDRKVTAI
ncbi:putative transcriptional regulator [Saprospira grandis DSM 2844]|uniref:Putative transcriptional regulator n=1 Tax=Saprospira grandis DSM 2844 TaxID=694433 RepID=J0P8X9_9BACT|nr:S24 family peptidase [Saprospira grandis]EJF54022.1 putative transcriptional regulator [Saprospira grandis DSM 2844]